MPHFPKPFYRENRGLWYVELNGKQHNLGHDRVEAFRRYHQLMQAPEPVVTTLVAGVIDGFLEWTKQHRSQRTFEWYLDFLQSFISSLPETDLATEDLKPFHVHRWVDSHKTWGASSKRGAITAVQRAFLWAEKLGHIDKSPIRHVEKPKAERRDNPLSQEDFDELIGEVKDRPFRDLLQFCWDTGCRPQEARHIEARHFVPERSTIELPPDEAKGKKRWRIIYLTESALQLVKRLSLARPTGKLLRNRRGQPPHNQALCNFQVRGRKQESFAGKIAWSIVHVEIEQSGSKSAAFGGFNQQDSACDMPLIVEAAAIDRKHFAHQPVLSVVAVIAGDVLVILAKD